MMFTSSLRQHLARPIAGLAIAASTFFITAPAVATGSDTLNLTTLSQHLGAQAPTCVNFEQRRWMQDLSIELPSSGYFQRQASGLVWQSLTPVNDRVVLSADNRDLSPGFKALLPVLTGLLDGNWDRLEEHFQTKLSGSLQAWQVDLMPRSNDVAERLNGIEVHGSEQVNSLKVMFSDGDQLTLDLTPVDCTTLTATAPYP